MVDISAKQEEKPDGISPGTEHKILQLQEVIFDLACYINDVI